MWRVLFMLLALVGTLSCAAPVLPSPTGLAADMHTDRPIRLWQDAAIFDSVDEVIATARTRLWVEMYEFGRTDLAQALLDRRRQGLDVRVIVDPSVAVSRGIAAWLLRVGVAVRFYPIDDARHQIDHVKLLLTDSRAVLGGMNWGAHSDLNHDYALELDPPPLLRRLDAVFAQDWALAGGEPAPLGIAQQSPIVQTAPGQEIRADLERDITTAHRRVHAEIFVLTDAQVITDLIEAKRRSLDVDVLMDPNQDVNLPAFAELRAAGVGVRWYPIPPGAKLHAKAGLFDQRLLLGSANWSLSGLSVNHELDMQTDDAEAVAAFGARFDSDWARAGSWTCCG